MESADKNIDWEKLVEALDGNNFSDTNINDIAGNDMLKMAKKIQKDMQNFNPEKKFPVDEGWSRFQAQAFEQQNTRNNASRKIWLPAAILLGLVIASAVFLVINKESSNRVPVVAKSSDSGSSDKVTVTLADGKKVEINNVRKFIEDANGKKIIVENEVIDYSKNSDDRDLPPSMNTIEVPRGKRATVILPDGTQVWLNAASKLEYPNAFRGETREVALIGEAYFSVTKSAAQPFFVNAKNMKVQVLGTSFNIETYSPSASAVLEQGRVKILAGDHATEMLPGERVLYDPLWKKLFKEKVDARIYTAWKDGDIYFVNLPFDRIAERLEREYDCNFQFKNPTLADLHFTIDIPRPNTIETILELLQESTPKLKFTVENKTVIVSQK